MGSHMDDATEREVQRNSHISAATSANQYRNPSILGNYGPPFFNQPVTSQSHPYLQNVLSYHNMLPAYNPGSSSTINHLLAQEQLLTARLLDQNRSMTDVGSSTSIRQDFPPRCVTPQGKIAYIGVFWDIENCSVPRGKSALLVVQRIRDRFFQPNYIEAEFVTVCDTSREPTQIIQELNDAQVTVIHVPGTSKNAADDKLRQAMRRFADAYSIVGRSTEYAQSHGTPAVLLISGDVNFCSDLSDLRYRKRLRIILLHNPHAPAPLVLCAHEHHNFHSGLEDIPLRPSVLQSKRQPDVTPRRVSTASTVLRNITHWNNNELQSVPPPAPSPKKFDVVVSNLPENLSSIQLEQKLSRLTANCGGKVVRISGQFGLIRFKSQDAAGRSARRINGLVIHGSRIEASFGSPQNNPSTSHSQRTAVVVPSPPQLPSASSSQSHPSTFPVPAQRPESSVPKSLIPVPAPSVPKSLIPVPAPSVPKSLIPVPAPKSLIPVPVPAEMTSPPRSKERRTQPVPTLDYPPEAPSTSALFAASSCTLSQGHEWNMWTSQDVVEDMRNTIQSSRRRQPRPSQKNRRIKSKSPRIKIKPEPAPREELRTSDSGFSTSSKSDQTETEGGVSTPELCRVDEDSCDTSPSVEIEGPNDSENGNIEQLIGLTAAISLKSVTEEIVVAKVEIKQEVEHFETEGEEDGEFVPEMEMKQEDSAQDGAVQVKNEVSGPFPNVMVDFEQFSTQVKRILNLANGSLELDNFCKSCEIIFGEWTEVGHGKGVALEHLITAVEGVELWFEQDGRKIVRFKRSEPIDDIEAGLGHPWIQLKNEMVKLLKKYPQSTIELSKLQSAYEVHYDKPLLSNDLETESVEELVNNLRSMSLIHFMGEVPDNVFVTLTHEVQMKCLAVDILRILKTRRMRILPLQDFGTAYTAVIGQTFDAGNYGLCSLRDLLKELTRRTGHIVLQVQADGELGLSLA